MLPAILTHSLTHSLQRTDAILVLFISTCTLFSFLKVPYPKVPQSLADSPCIHHVFCPFEQPSQHPQIFHGHRKLSQFLSHASSQDENIRGGPENREQFTVGTESQPGYFCLWLDVSLYFSIHVFLWMFFFNGLFWKGNECSEFWGSWTFQLFHAAGRWWAFQTCGEGHDQGFSRGFQINEFQWGRQWWVQCS